MEQLSFLLILIIAVVLLGVFLIVRTIKMPKSFNGNTELFKDVRKKVKEKEQDNF